MDFMKRFWIKDHRYDWYDSRKQGNAIERRFYEGKARLILRETDMRGKAVLDLACGGGVCTGDISRSARFTVGIDISAWAIKLARKRFPGVSYVVADSERLPFREACFDVVVNTGLFQYFKDPSPTVKETERILKRGGRTIVEVPWKHGPYNIRAIRSMMTNKKNRNREPMNRSYTKAEFSHHFRGFRQVGMKTFFMSVIYGVFEKK
jgi:ubiquinone/menaquinone biosynthesis C-methylase UbiE